MNVEDITFREVQQLPRGWILLGLFVALLETGVFGWGCIQQVMLHHVWGNHPLSNTDLLTITFVVCAITWGIVLLLTSARLITEVRSDGLFLQYVPFHRRMIKVPLELAESVDAVTYRPVLEYGGWGIRWRLDGKAYNVRGNRGVRIRYADGRHLLIGSQMPDQLADALRPLLA